MVGGHEGYVGAEAHVVPDVDAGVVHHHQVEVGEKVLPDEGVTAVVELDRALEVAYLAHASQNVPQHVGPGGIVLIHGIVLPAGLMGDVLEILQFLPPGVEHLPGKNLFFLRHDSLI